MHTALIIALYFSLIAEGVSFLVTLTQAGKPREEVDSNAGCMGGLLILGCGAAPLLLALGDYGVIATALAVWLALSLLYDMVQFVRQIHGVRGERTPVSTSVHAAWALANLGVILYVLLVVKP